MGNAQTFIDLREDPDWATLDVAGLSRFAGPVLITCGDMSPPWLGRTPLAVAEQAGVATQVIAGAGHAPQLTHPDALVAVVEDVAGRSVHALRRR
jgi:pimeloyl-ACP methyl ester carboxylesterase